MDINRMCILSRSTADKKNLHCAIVLILNLKDSMRLMQKLTYFPCQQDSRLQMHLKSKGYMDTVLFPTISKAGDVLSPYIGKLDIYCRIRSLGKSAANFNIFLLLFPAFEYWDKNLLPTYLHFYLDKYPTYQ
jgi:hypothetical protein